LSVSRLFDDSAAFYDRINRVIGFGLGERYRGQVLARAGLTPGMTVLDVGCGTGVLGEHARRLVGPSGRVLGLDPSRGMLAIARGKRALESVQARAEHLPLADGSVDFLVMGYALRQLPRLDPVFAEFARVLRPGGRLLMLELVPPQRRLARSGFRAYLRHLVPWLVARHRSERAQARQLMEHTWTTIVRTAPPPQVLATLRAHGFEAPAFRRFAQVLGEYAACRG
jgi:demethylmenaquinone methyltransferase/2-methoxy-6-polyprenyl-1,4-benzoquinol methylase